jgi:L-rhamnose mutarotase
MRYCLALDLKDDPRLIARYEQLHRRIWPEIAEHLRRQGVLSMEIYRLGDTVDDVHGNRRCNLRCRQDGCGIAR